LIIIEYHLAFQEDFGWAEETAKLIGFSVEETRGADENKLY